MRQTRPVTGSMTNTTPNRFTNATPLTGVWEVMSCGGVARVTRRGVIPVWRVVLLGRTPPPFSPTVGVIAVVGGARASP